MTRRALFSNPFKLPTPLSLIQKRLPYLHLEIHQHELLLIQAQANLAGAKAELEHLNNRLNVLARAVGDSRNTPGLQLPPIS